MYVLRGSAYSDQVESPDRKGTDAKSMAWRIFLDGKMVYFSARCSNRTGRPADCAVRRAREFAATVRITCLSTAYYALGDVEDPERSLTFWGWNRGKRSAAWDLDAADGQAAHDAAECRTHSAEKPHRLDAVADDDAARKARHHLAKALGLEQ